MAQCVHQIGIGADLSARCWPLMWPVTERVEERLEMVRIMDEEPARRLTRSLALGRSSGSVCRQSLTSCFSSYVQSSGTLHSYKLCVESL